MSEHAKGAAQVPDTLLATLEHDFSEAMTALEGEESLGHFRLEYDKLYRALKKSHEAEQQIVAHCQQLTQDLLSNAAKMQAAVKLSQGDHSTIEALKKEIEKAWRTVDVVKTKDLRARETVQTLQQEIASLQTMIQDGSSLTTDHTTTLEQLKLDNKRLMIESEDLTKEMEGCTREMSEFTVSLRQLREGTEASHTERQQISDRYELVRQEYRRERNARERAEYQCRELLVTLKMREKALKDRKNRLTAVEASVSSLEGQLLSNQREKQALQQKLETAEKQLFHTQQSYNDSVDTTTDLTRRLQDIDRQMLVTERHINESRDGWERAQRIAERDFKVYERLKQQNENLRKEDENLIYQKDLIDKRITSVRRDKENLREALQLINKECKMLSRKGEKEVLSQNVVQKLIETESAQQKEMEECIEQENEISNRLKETLHRLEKDRESCIGEISQVNEQTTSASEELKVASLQVEEAQKKLDESERCLTDQQSKYEQMRAERNQLSKKLVDAQDEIVELKQRLKLIDHQSVQFKEELLLKNKKYQTDSSKFNIVKERLMKARQLVNDNTAAFDETKVEGDRIAQEIKHLVKVVKECDQNLTTQQQSFLAMSNERDVLAAQLIRRNNELGLLYEKLQLLQDTVNTGEAAYRARMDDYRMLRLKTKEVSNQSFLASVRAKDIAVIKERLRKTAKDVAVEQAKVSALSEELENPQNQSRWRQIPGKDLSMEELESKMTVLHRQLLTKSEECLKQELLYEEKQRLVTELQSMVDRQPGPEVSQQLSIYQKELRRRNAQMKKQASEINMTATHIVELKYEIQRLRRELQETRQKYYEVKVKNDTVMRSMNGTPRGATV